MTTPHWYIDTYILDSKPAANEKLRQALSKYQVTYTKYIPFTEKQEGLRDIFDPYEVNLCYGTHGFIRNMQNTFGKGSISPYLVESKMECINYYPKLPAEWMLNAGCFFVPFAMLEPAINNFEGAVYSELFVRPNSGFKAFIPQVIPTFGSSLSQALSNLKDKYQVEDSTLCLVAPVSIIYFEIRYVIVDRKVVSASFYRLKGELYEEECLIEDLVLVEDDTGKAIPFDNLEHYVGQAQVLAQKMAAHAWQPDIAYMCDVALTDSGVCKIIELNAFCCAGLYGCDYEKVFDAVTAAFVSRN